MQFSLKQSVVQPPQKLTLPSKKITVDKVIKANSMVLMPESLQGYQKKTDSKSFKMASDLKLINEKVSSMSLASTVDLSQSNRSNSGNGILSSQDSSPLGTAMILKEESKVDYTKIMLERWNKSNQILPLVDQQDISEECPIFNKGKKSHPEHQNHPEFTQTCYLRIRHNEEVFLTKNYLDQNPQPERLTLGQKFQNSINLGKSKLLDKTITQQDRSYGIQKIFDLHIKKEYKNETLFVATSIFDRYINSVGASNFPKSQIVCLSTISILMAAKLEQPISPSFTRMISLLTEEEKKVVTKQKLIDMETNILITFGFDFNFPGPLQSMERYLRLLDYDLNSQLYEMCFQICKFQLNDETFLKYRPSMIAACSIILAINIYEKDLEKYKNKGFFKNCAVKNNLTELNLDIWNNQNIHNLTGYSIEDLKKCLFDLATFISNNLQPNRLITFDINAILKTNNYDGPIPQNIQTVLMNHE